MRPTTPFPTFVLATVLLLVPPSFAADPEEEAGEDEAKITVEDELLVEDTIRYLPDEASTATKTSTPLRLLPASVTSLSRTLLEDQNALILGDALRNVPGVNVMTNTGVHDLFFIRGIESLSGGLVMTDGAPEPEATFYQLYNVDRVEVVRGAAGFLYGGNPIGGAVNLVRKRPAAGTFTQVGADVGSHSTSRTTLDFNHGNASGTFGFRLNGMWQQSDGYRDDKASRVTAVNPVVTFLAGERNAVTLSAEFQASRFAPDAGLPLLPSNVFDPLTLDTLADVPRETSYQSLADFSDQDALRLRVEVETALGNDVTLRNKTYYTSLDWQTQGTLLNGAFPTPFGTFIVSRNGTLLDDTQELLGHQLDVLFTRETGSVRHEITAGLEVSQLKDEFALTFSLLPDLDLENPVLVDPEPGFAFPPSVADATATVIAPYILDNLRFSDRFSLLLGGRFDSIDFEDDARGVSESDSQLSPFVGALFAPNERLSLYANYAESFAPASTTSTDPERRPEEGQQFEVGVKGELWGGKLRPSIALFRLEKEGLAVVDQSGITSQAGDLESQGIELELAGSPRQDLYWTFTYAYTDAEITRLLAQIIGPGGPILVGFQGQTPAFVPEHLASLWFTRRFGNGLGLGAGARYVGEQFNAPSNVFTLDAYTTLDAAFYYERERWGVSLHLQNLTDEEYETRGFGGSSVLPADGFHATGGLKVRL